MVNHDILLLGASAGGVDALMTVCRGLKADLPAAVLVVQHVAPTARSVLPAILARAGRLPVSHAEDSQPIRPGRIFIAPPDFHLLVSRDGTHLLLRRGPQENRTRPSIDTLFRSAAAACGSRVIGVVLSGLLDDGTAGLAAIKACGGMSVVQNPEDAAWPDMPRNALRGDTPDHCAAIADMAELLDRLVRSPAGPTCPVPLPIAAEVRIAEQDIAAFVHELHALGTPTRMSCPQCGGVLNEIRDGTTTRFRCQIGHAYGAASLAVAQTDALEKALATAIRTHRDREQLFRRMQEAAEARGLGHAAARWHRAAEEARYAATLITTAIETLHRPHEAETTAKN